MRALSSILIILFLGLLLWQLLTLTEQIYLWGDNAKCFNISCRK